MADMAGRSDVSEPAETTDGGFEAPVRRTLDEETAGQAALRRLEAVGEILGGWVWETDAAHRFVYLSPSVEQHAGHRPEAYYGKTRDALNHVVYRLDDSSNWRAQLEGCGPFGPLEFVLHVGSEARLMQTVGRPQFDQAGVFTGYIGVAFEVKSKPKVHASERRTEVRNRVVRAAEVLLPDAGGAVTCVLADLSTGGARLLLPDNVQIPRAFRLKVDALAIDRACRMRWRRGTSMGLEFVD